MINVVDLNHPTPISLLGPSTEKLSSMKPVPGAQKIRVCCSEAFTDSPKKRLEGFEDATSGKKKKKTKTKPCLLIQDT